MIHRSLESLERSLPGGGLPPAVVVGLCAHGLAIVRTLARRGVPVVVIESNWSQPSTRTRFGHKLHHPDVHGASLPDVLLRLSERLPPMPVLFLTNDRMVRAVNRAQDALASRYHLPFPRPDLVDELIEKDRLGPLAVRQGLRVPRTVLVSGVEARAGAESTALRDAPFPCVVKPATPMSAIKALLVPDRAALARVASEHPEIDRYLLQEWVEGGDDRVAFAAYYFDRSGSVRGAFAGRKIRQVPRTLGNSSAARGEDRPDLIAEGLRLFRGLDYRGIASVEFKLAPDGAPWFIEATVGRSDYWLKTLLVNGVDLPAIVYGDKTGIDLRPSERQRNRAAWVDGDRDLGVWLESWSDPGIPKRRLLAELLEPRRWALFDLGDPMPYVAWWRTFLGRVAAAAARRLAPRRVAARAAGDEAPPALPASREPRRAG